MRDALYLAAAYLRHHLGRTAILVVALGLILTVPLVSRSLLASAEDTLSDRARTTPLLIGAKGAALDQIMNGLYFTQDLPERITMAQVDRVWDSGLAVAIPLHVVFRAGGAPIVGTTLDYFDMRGLAVDKGRGLGLLGEAVLGAEAAKRLDLGPGDTLLSDPTNLFDLAGSYPLQMTVVGVLAPTGRPDDDAVFVDIRTAWVIEGLGHGHDDVVDGALVVAETDQGRTLSAAVAQFTVITPQNVDSFHFHGDPQTYPVSSIIAVPWDDKSSAILRGRYLGAEERAHVVLPATVIEGLLATIFRISQLLDGVIVVIGAAAGLAVALAIYLSTRLRADEMATARRLGAHRFMQVQLIGAEIFLQVIAAIVLSALLTLAVSPYIGDIAIWLIRSTP
ncbi:MAG: ABC transporter permease [Pseudomonadota bacterium]